MPCTVKLCFDCTLHLVQSLQKTGQCKTKLLSLVRSVLQGAGLFFSLVFHHRKPTLEHSCHIIVLSNDKLYVYKSNQICTYTGVPFLFSDLLLSIHPCLCLHTQLVLQSEQATLIGFIKFYPSPIQISCQCLWWEDLEIKIFQQLDGIGF